MASMCVTGRCARVVALLAMVFFPAQLSAAFHLMSVKEVYGGSPAAPNARYVVLQMYADGQNFVNGHSISFFNASGAANGTVPFTRDVTSGANQATILIATAEAATLFGLIPDFSMTAAALTPAGGKVCFETIDCVAWGNYTGSSIGVGPPFNSAGGITPGRAVRRRMDIAGSPTVLESGDDTNQSANDFRFAPPRPRNNAGQSGVVTPTTTTLTSSLNPSSPGDPVTFTAAVTPQEATGIVTFKNGQADLGTALLGNSATLTTSTLTEGTHSITAVYEGDAAFDPSTSAPVMQMVAAAGLSAPGMFLATATSESSVALTWSAVSGATGYEVFRTTSVAGGYALAATTSGTAVLDGLPLNANTTYLYKVRAVGAGGPSPFTSIDIATTTVFDGPAPGGVIVKAAHVLQLRTAVNAIRVAADHASFVFSDSPSLAGMTIRELHITDLREALDEARVTLGFGALPYTDPTLTPGVTAVKADHILQLRDRTQ